MTIPFYREGICLPVSQALLYMLCQEIELTEIDLERCTELNFRFHNPDYSKENGGIQPVDIRLIRGLDGWLFDCITDYCYQEPDDAAPLCKEFDFNFLDREYRMLGWGSLAEDEAHELFSLWQSQFVAYYRLDCFTVNVTGN